MRFRKGPDRRWLGAALVAVLPIAHPSAVDAQSAPLVLEVHGGGAVPTGSFSHGAAVGEGTSAGVTYGVDLALAGRGRRALYFGFGQHRFPCADAGCARGERYVATGFDAGLRFQLRMRGSVQPWVRVGVVTTRVEVPGLPTVAAGVSRLGVGGEGGFGVLIGAASAVAISPGVRYAAVNTTLPGGATLRMRYLLVDLTLVLAF